MDTGVNPQHYHSANNYYCNEYNNNGNDNYKYEGYRHHNSYDYCTGEILKTTDTVAMDMTTVEATIAETTMTIAIPVCTMETLPQRRLQP